jgi:hypothetical protein
MTSIPISIRRKIAWIVLATVAGASLLAIFVALRPTVRRVTRDPTVIEGRVVWSDGTSAGGARVEIVAVQADQRSSETVADEAGLFRFVGFSTRSCAITAQILDTSGPVPRITALGHLEPVHPAAAPCEVRLVRLLPMRGRVVDSGNRPVRSVHVRVTGSGALIPFLPKDGRETEVDGRFEVYAPEGDVVSLEGTQRSSFQDIVTEVGPTARWTGMPGTDEIVLWMPNER